jgi:DNA-directed RNA polymerase specialized sigma subunit
MSQTIDLNPERLRELYWEQEMTLQEVADECGVSVDTVRDRMRTHDIPRRSRSIDRPEKRLLVYLYWTEYRTTHEIAEQFDVSQPSVLRWMSEYDIPRRKEGHQRDEHEQ